MIVLRAEREIRIEQTEGVVEGWGARVHKDFVGGKLAHFRDRRPRATG